MKFFAKELSWLAFNERVLQEAADKSVPVIERVRFLGIFSSNMDEFFQVRVADVRRKIFFAKDNEEKEAAQRLLRQIQDKVIALQLKFDEIQNEVVIALARKNIFIINEQQLTDAQRDWVVSYFHDKIKRYIVPLIISPKSNLLKHLKEDRIYFGVELQMANELLYAAVEVPTEEVPRFVRLPHQKSKRRKDVILLDNIIAMCLGQVLHLMFDCADIRSYSFKLTRDADYRLPHDIDQGLLERMEEGIKQREQADPVRLVYDRAMPEAMLKFLCKKLHMNEYDSRVAGGSYRNTRDYQKFPNFGRKSLAYPPMPAIEHPRFLRDSNVFEVIAKRDVLLYFPYHKFAHVTEILRQAAYDPAVRKIQICVYRVAPNSRIMRSLMEAVHNNKHVKVTIELQARFDEEANIELAKELTDAGVHVVFGISGLKVHAKLFLIHREEASGVRRYAYIGTGNFNEKTAKVYTDFALMTASPEICSDVENVFTYLDTPYLRPNLNKLMVSPVNLRERFVALLEVEIANAQQGKRAELLVKVNNLVDEAIIVQLYRASRMGVKIRCIVRGMCSLRAGVPGLSENIEVRSIVDRFLEHPRVYWFYQDGANKVFMSSADLMTRNIDHRVEVACPLEDPECKQQVMDIMQLQWKDNCKARLIDADQRNEYVNRGNKKKVRSQVEILNYLLAHARSSNSPE
ncbi:polyphosphate kinase 1 [Aliidiomarina iranensis]|uniref:Polyphosphate kinase n=1 Tax=Aliidiomarina iranensis TaxID=1434071 RepID=A0A432VZU1_9GAMM|nr:polyphosphate kinase 1 [Aliidiomarina iranensis]RUO22255.1 polyphosphate kinase 1 [Aliidiomarina iranensis]